MAVLATATCCSCWSEESDTTGSAREVEDRPTRFDSMKESAPPPREKRGPDVARVVAQAERLVISSLDRVMTIAVAAVLTQDPTDMEAARSFGEAVGTAQRVGDFVVLRLGDATGAVFASVRGQHLVSQPCWSTLWQPDWAPAASTGTGAGLQGEASLVWWRFGSGEEPPYLVRFGPDGVALWRPDAEAGCYRGESLLGLVGGGLRAFDYLSPVAPTDGADPSESGETAGTKPLWIDLLKSRGKEQIRARNGRVELRTKRGKRLQRWTTTLPRGSVACTQAAVHRFDGDPERIFFEIEFTDDDACDEIWEKHEVQQTLFEVRDSKLVAVLSGGASVYGEGEAASGSAERIDVGIPTGVGQLRYVGQGKSRQDEVGGERWFDCSAWAGDEGIDAADTAFTESSQSGVWTFVTEDGERPVGEVSALVRTFQCAEADD